MRSIVWLASYPKSGNTWLRAFLINYLFAKDKPVPINKIHLLGMGDSIINTYRKVGGKNFLPNDPNHILSLRHKVLKSITGNGADINFVKTHNENSTIKHSVLIPAQLTRSAIHLIRNPLDVTVSFAKHYNLTIDKTISQFNNEKHIILPDAHTTTQFLNSWSNHCNTWQSESRFPVLTVRYEDLIQKPEASFRSILNHLKIPLEQPKLDMAIQFSSFSSLQKQEANNGFVENQNPNSQFFRKGQVDQWKTILSKEQAQRVYGHHKKVMQRFNYSAEK